MSEDGFARERLGWWANASDRALIDAKVWKALATKTPPEDGKLAYGVKFSPDGASVAWAVALKPEEGPVHVEIAEHRSMAHGVSWLATALAERKSQAAVMVIDGLSGAPALLEELRKSGVSTKALIAPRAGDVIAAASMFLNAVTEKQLSHFAQPAFTASVLGACRRDIGNRGGWGFGPLSDDIDVSLTEAAALAFWAVTTTKRRPGRKMRLL
jgi:hypothetical protein